MRYLSNYHERRRALASFGVFIPPKNYSQGPAMTRHYERQGRNVWISIAIITVIVIAMSVVEYVGGVGMETKSIRLGPSITVAKESYEMPTMALRMNNGVLEQGWSIENVMDGRVVGRTSEWRPVPVVNDPAEPPNA